jgi:hypothetical protein
LREKEDNAAARFSGLFQQVAARLMRCVRFLTAAKVVFYFEIAHFSITRNAKKAFGFSLSRATMRQE